jgi:putative lipoic acid-binding regulatory protein
VPPEDDVVANEEQARARALALLEAVHQFPGDYAVTVIAFNGEAVTEAIRVAARPARAAIEEASAAPPPGEDEYGFAAYEVRPSREGKYLSHRFTVRVANAQEVLDLYARLRVVEGVLTIL